MQQYLNKTNIIIGAALLIVVIGGAVYFGWKSPENLTTGGAQNQLPTSGNMPPSSSGEQNRETNQQTVNLANIQNADSSVLSSESVARLPIGSLIKLTNEPISSLVSSGNGSVRFHKNIPDALAHLFERRADGTNKESKISNFTIPKVAKVVWATGGTKAVIFYDLSGEIKKLLIDYKSTSTPKTLFLPDSVSDVAFSPDGKLLAFINDLGETRNIFIATSDFKNQKKILNNIIPGLEISWPGASLLAVKTKSSYASKGYLYTFTTSGGNFTKVVEGFGLDAVWNSDGSGVLISTVTNRGKLETIKYIDIKTSAITDLAFETIAEKCAFLKTKKTIAYCAVPKSPVSAKYPDAWWQGTISFLDDIVSVNVSDGSISTITSAELDIVRPTALDDDSFLVFQDKNTGFLWSAKLK